MMMVNLNILTFHLCFVFRKFRIHYFLGMRTSCPRFGCYLLPKCKQYHIKYYLWHIDKHFGPRRYSNISEIWTLALFWSKQFSLYNWIILNFKDINIPLQVPIKITLSDRKSNPKIQERPSKSAFTIGCSKYIFPLSIAVVNVSATSVKIDLKLKVSYISFDKRKTDEPVSTSIFMLTPSISSLANQQLLETVDNLRKESLIKSSSVIFQRAGLLVPI